MMNGPTPRAERGEVRYLVLDAVAGRPRHGYEIIQTIQDRTDGQYRPSPGVIYPTLQMLEELGHVRVVEEEGRKAYAITDAGRQDLESNRGSVDEFYERFDEEPWEAYAEEVGEMMHRVAKMARELRRGARRGRMTPDVMRVIREAFDEAVTKIEAALAQKR